jgi:hypothetical protein
VTLGDRWHKRSVLGGVGRALGAATFAAAFACLWLPFLVGGAPAPNPIAAGAPSITYTGLDLAFGGTADVLIPIWPPDGSAYRPTPVTDLDLYGHPQSPLAGNAYGVSAAVIISVGALASLIPATRLRTIVASAAGLVSALSLLALETADRLEVARMLTPLLGPLLGLDASATAPVRLVSPRYGFYLAMTLLTFVGLANVVAAVPRSEATVKPQIRSASR